MERISNLMNNFYFTTFKALLVLEDFNTSLERISAYHGEEFDDDAVFIVSNGDVNFTDHLRLDIDLGWTTNDKRWLNKFPGLEAQKSDERVEGLIIFGNLNLKGSILNEEGDYGAFLYVSGQITCQSLVAGGSVIYVKNDVTAEEVFISHYNHGYFRCDGLVSSPILIIYDHYTTLSNFNASLFYYNDNTGQIPSGNDCYEGEDGDWLCANNLTKLLDNPTLTFEDLIFDLSEGEYVLSTARHLLDKDELYWLQKVNRDWSNLKRIPAELKTKQFFEKAYAKHGPLCFSYFPETYITAEHCEQAIKKSGINLRYIPQSLLTKDICCLAAKHKTHIAFIPVVYLDENLIKEIIHYNESQMSNVPDEFITEELLIAYVKLGRGLWLDKYCEIANVSKNTVLFKALDSGITAINEIWGFHFQEVVYLYAKDLYNNEENEEAWNSYVEKFQKKIDRIIQ
ncbi:hypothetical protein OQX61_23290 [Pedobacter sp. PLR]|uniref:hypothetical protein n=1 Tax=Pedobacter sp. PLR TaxID=2994465 RepID=UPI0022479D9B|nr:hypothetical protein [Pedobacter sp. PLR]MCX2454215.1 hypothetical protein [Pedobacter sp. PLR]